MKSQDFSIGKMSKPSYQKAGLPGSVRLPQGSSCKDQIRLAVIPILKVLSSIVLLLVIYDVYRAIIYRNHGLAGTWDAPPAETVASTVWEHALGSDDEYLLGVGKADITG